MKLKTHWHLAEQLHREFENDLHKFFFKIGNTLPDLLPHLRVKPHTAESAHYIRKRMRILSQKRGRQIFFSMKLGIITHFLSDFSCIAHKEGYSGSFLDHHNHEKMLNRILHIGHDDLTEALQTAKDAIHNILMCHRYGEIIQESV